MGVPNAKVTHENLLLGTWKLQSVLHEIVATGKRSYPFGDHPEGYLSYSSGTTRDTRLNSGRNRKDRYDSVG
jgi:Lipocalin-like domain